MELFGFPFLLLRIGMTMFILGGLCAVGFGITGYDHASMASAGVLGVGLVLGLISAVLALWAD